MKVGDRVRWSSQAGGQETSKTGRIVAVVPPDTKPDPLIPEGYEKKNPAPSGNGRKTESYWVALGQSNKVHWPLVKYLTLIAEKEVNPNDKIKRWMPKEKTSEEPASASTASLPVPSAPPSPAYPPGTSDS